MTIIGVRSPAKKRFFPEPHVQTGSEDQPASIQWLTGVLSRGVKCGRGVRLITEPHLRASSYRKHSLGLAPSRRQSVTVWYTKMFDTQHVDMSVSSHRTPLA
jgi:hypothetical protein